MRTGQLAAIKIMEVTEVSIDACSVVFCLTLSP